MQNFCLSSRRDGKRIVYTMCLLSQHRKRTKEQGKQGWVYYFWKFPYSVASLPNASFALMKLTVVIYLFTLWQQQTLVPRLQLSRNIATTDGFVVAKSISYFRSINKGCFNVLKAIFKNYSKNNAKIII